MAHHPSAKKRIRQTKRRTQVNRARVSRIRTFLRKVETAIASGYNRQPEFTAKIHRNTVARKLSRLSARIKAMQS